MAEYYDAIKGEFKDGNANSAETAPSIDDEQRRRITTMLSVGRRTLTMPHDPANYDQWISEQGARGQRRWKNIANVSKISLPVAALMIHFDEADLPVPSLIELLQIDGRMRDGLTKPQTKFIEELPKRQRLRTGVGLLPSVAAPMWAAGETALLNHLDTMNERSLFGRAVLLGVVPSLQLDYQLPASRNQPAELPQYTPDKAADDRIVTLSDPLRSDKIIAHTPGNNHSFRARVAIIAEADDITDARSQI